MTQRYTITEIANTNPLATPSFTVEYNGHIIHLTVQNGLFVITSDGHARSYHSRAALDASLDAWTNHWDRITASVAGRADVTSDHTQRQLAHIREKILNNPVPIPDEPLPPEGPVGGPPGGGLPLR